VARLGLGARAMLLASGCRRFAARGEMDSAGFFTRISRQIVEYAGTLAQVL
jgi:hypothetical protein